VGGGWAVGFAHLGLRRVSGSGFRAGGEGRGRVFPVRGPVDAFECFSGLGRIFWIRPGPGRRLVMPWGPRPGRLELALSVAQARAVAGSGRSWSGTRMKLRV
jgi:hypothetical protein